MNQALYMRRIAVVLLLTSALASLFVAGALAPRAACASDAASSTDLVLLQQPGRAAQSLPDAGNLFIQERVDALEHGARQEAASTQDDPASGEALSGRSALAQTGDAFRDVLGVLGVSAFLGALLLFFGLIARHRDSSLSSRTSWKKTTALVVSCLLALAVGHVGGPSRAYAADAGTSSSASSLAGSAYAVLTGDGEFILFRSENAYTNRTTGTFTDLEGNAYTGQIFADFETVSASSASSVRWYNWRTSIKSVRFVQGQTIAPTSTAYWFNGCTRLVSCDLTPLDTTRLTTAEHMFSGCTNAAFNPNLSTWDTSTLKSTAYMFSACSGASFDPDVSAWDVSHVTTFASMFHGCSGASFNPDVSSWDTSSAAIMSNLFYGCSGSSFNPDVSAWDVSHVTNMTQLFYGCSGASFNPDVSLWDTSRATLMSGLFNGCSGRLFNPDVSSWDTSQVTSLYGMFANCYGESLSPDVSAWDTSKVTSMQSMFYGCRRLESLDLSDWDTSCVTTMLNMFYECVSLKRVTLGEGFSFSGASILSPTQRAVLPTPPSEEPYTGMWINASTEGAPPVSAGELRDNYDGTLAEGKYARGTYVWEEVRSADLILDVAGGSTDQSYPTVYEPGTSLLLPGTEGAAFAAPTRYGFDFIGWLNEEGQLVEEVGASSTGPRSFMASWVASNLSFTVPASLTYTVCADGQLVGPEQAYIENDGPWPIRVVSIVVASEDGWSIVEDAAACEEPNAVDLSFSAQGVQLRATGGSEAFVENPVGAWRLAPASEGEGCRLVFETSGHASRLTNDLRILQHFATLRWCVELAPEPVEKSGD